MQNVNGEVRRIEFIVLHTFLHHFDPPPIDVHTKVQNMIFQPR